MESSPFLLVQPWWRVGKAHVDLCHSKAAIPLQPQPLQASRSCQCVALAFPDLFIAALALSSLLSCHSQLSKSKVCGRRDVPESQHEAEEHGAHCATQLSPLTWTFSF